MRVCILLAVLRMYIRFASCALVNFTGCSLIIIFVLFVQHLGCNLSSIQLPILQIANKERVKQLVLSQHALYTVDYCFH